MEVEGEMTIETEKGPKGMRRSGWRLRFWDKAIPEPNTGCWLWMGTQHSKGYGTVRAGRLPTFAHRVAYEMTHGPIPKGLLVCHRCDVRWCVNPTHLFVGTHRDNMDDMKRKGRAATGTRNGMARDPHLANRAPGESNPMAKLTWSAVAEIRAAHATGEVQQRIADRFGVCDATINRIVKNKSWVLP
jgi:hypothetical protein